MRKWYLRGTKVRVKGRYIGYVLGYTADAFHKVRYHGEHDEVITETFRWDKLEEIKNG